MSSAKIFTHLNSFWKKAEFLEEGRDPGPPGKEVKRLLGGIFLVKVGRLSLGPGSVRDPHQRRGDCPPTGLTFQREVTVHLIKPRMSWDGCDCNC